MTGFNRADSPILVAEAGASGAIGAIRSLGRAGYPVHAASQDADAIGLFSRYAAFRCVHPPYRSTDFVPWMRAYVARHRIAAIVPSEGFLMGALPQIEAFLPMLPDSPSFDLVRRCFSKAAVIEAFQSSGDPAALARLPQSWVVRRGEYPPAELSEVCRYPLYVKLDSVDSDDCLTSFVRRAGSIDDLRRILAEAFAVGRQCLVQESVPGVKVCYNVFLHHGGIVAETMCVASHENPHRGGLTALRRLWWHEGIAEDARARLRLLGWNGVAMVEYKYDAATGRYWFIELNARYWAALNLDLLAGVDFPKLQLDAHFSGTTPAYATERRPIACRFTFPADAGYALSKIRDASVPVFSRLWAALEFGLLFLHPGLKSDMWFPGDRGLYWKQMARFFANLGKKA
jgi:hypothetical protein